jgi:hypothetical protein
VSADREATQRQLAELESELAAALSQYGGGEVDSIRLAPGAEEVDLSSNIDVLVRSRGAAEREFTVVTLAAMTRFLTDETFARELGDLYTAGGPLIVVRKMSADVIARGVVKYLRMERGSR